MTWLRSLTRYLIGLVVGFHGMVYLIFALYSQYINSAGWKGSSLLLGNAITGDTLKAFTMGLWAIAGVGLIATGIAIAFAPWLHGLWRPLAIGASLVSLLSFVIFWDGQTASFTSQGGIGMFLSLTILVGAIAFPKALGALGFEKRKDESKLMVER